MRVEDLKTVPPEEQQIEPVNFHGELIEIPDDLSSLPEANLKGEEYEKYINPDSPEAEPLRIVMANLEGNVGKFSREATHNELQKTDEGSPRWRRFAKSVWHTMTRPYQIVKTMGEKRQDILESGNLFHHHGKSDERQREAVVKRYSSKYGEKLIHEEAGETFVKLGAKEAANDDDALEIRGDVLKLVEDFAKGDLKEDSFEQTQKDMFNRWLKRGIGQQYIGEGKFLAHNLLAMARQAKAAYDAREGIEGVDRDAELTAMLEKAEIITGEAKIGSNVELADTVSERLAEKMRGKKWMSEGRLSRVASFLGNEVFVAAAMSGVVYAGKRVFSGATAVLMPGAGAAVLAGVRERYAMRDERALLAMRLDAGQEIDTTNIDQVEIAETLYAAEKSTKLIEQLRDLYGEDGELKLESREDLEAALKLQGEIYARFRVETAQGKEGKPGRLIDYTEGDSETSGDRKFLLDMALAKLEADLEQCFADPDAAVKLEINPDEEYRDLLEQSTSIAMGLYSQETRDKDQDFNRQVWHRGLKRAAIVALTSVLTREVVDAVGDMIRNPGQVFEKIKDFFTARTPSGATPTIVPMGFEVPGGEGSGPVDATRVGGEQPGPIDATRIGGETGAVDATRIGGPESGAVDATRIGGESGAVDATRIGGEGGPVDATRIGGEILTDGKTLDVNENTKVTLPEGYKVAKDGDTVTVNGPDGKTFQMQLDKNGFPTEKSVQDLRDSGFQVYDSEGVKEGEPKVTHEKVTRNEFYEKHKHEMTKISIQDWADNNTSKYDLNELRLDNSLRKDGSVLISADRMFKDGSFSGSEHFNWREAAKDGKLMVYISSSEETQGRAFELKVNTDGHVVVENDHPARALFNKEGEFIGGFQRVAIKGGENEKGATKIVSLATIVGKDAPGFRDVVTTPTLEETHHYTIVPPKEMEPRSVETPGEDRDDTVAVPIYGRRRLGDAIPGEPPVAPTPPNMALPPAPNRPALPPAPGLLELTAAPEAQTDNNDPAARRANTPTATTTNAGKFDANTSTRAQSPNTSSGSSFDNDSKPRNDAPDAGSSDESEKRRGSNHGTAFASGVPQYSEAEREAFEKIGEMKLNMPSGFRVNFDNVGGLSQNIAIALILEVIKNNPRLRYNGKPEKLDKYRARVVASMRLRAGTMMAQLGAVTPSARFAFISAFNAVLTVTPEPASPPRSK